MRNTFLFSDLSGLRVDPLYLVVPRWKFQTQFCIASCSIDCILSFLILSRRSVMKIDGIRFTCRGKCPCDRSFRHSRSHEIGSGIHVDERNRIHKIAQYSKLLSQCDTAASGLSRGIRVGSVLQLSCKGIIKIVVQRAARQDELPSLNSIDSVSLAIEACLIAANRTIQVAIETDACGRTGVMEIEDGNLRVRIGNLLRSVRYVLCDQMPLACRKTGLRIGDDIGNMTLPICRDQFVRIGLVGNFVPLITLNPSTLTFLLDRLFSNLFKMIKVGITKIRTRNVIIAFLSSLSERRRSSKIDIRPGALFPHYLELGHGNGRAIELEADLGFRHD